MNVSRLQCCLSVWEILLNEKQKIKTIIKGGLFQLCLTKYKSLLKYVQGSILY